MKKLILPVLLCAVALSSCSKNEITEQVFTTTSDDPEAIRLDIGASSTKGEEVFADDLRANLDIDMYYQTATTTGTITFAYVSSSAGWVQVVDGGDEALKWSDLGGEDGGAYPVTFYSFIEGLGSDGTTTNASYLNIAPTYTSTSATTNGTFTVGSSNIEKHIDLIASSTVLQAAPSGNAFTAVYDHALSKADVRLITQTSTIANEVMILKADFKNLINEGTNPTITAATDAISWTVNDNSTTNRAVAYSLADATMTLEAYKANPSSFQIKDYSGYYSTTLT